MFPIKIAISWRLYVPGTYPIVSLIVRQKNNIKLVVTAYIPSDLILCPHYIPMIFLMIHAIWALNCPFSGPRELFGQTLCHSYHSGCCLVTAFYRVFPSWTVIISNNVGKAINHLYLDVPAIKILSDWGWWILLLY